MKAGAKWGVILGVSIVVWTLVIHFLGFYTTRLAAGQRADVVAVILPIVAIAMALRDNRRQTGHSPSIGQSIGIALVVGLVSVPFSVAGLWWYHHYVNPQWVDLLVDFQRQNMTAAGASADAIARAESAQRASATDGAQLRGAVIGTALISIIIGLVSGVIIRLRRGSSRA